MANVDRYALAVDATFLKQVLVAMLDQCATVLTESPSVAGHPLRAAFAVACIADPATHQQRIAYAIITQTAQVGAAPTVPSAITDANVLTAVTNVWNALSGYYPN